MKFTNSLFVAGAAVLAAFTGNAEAATNRRGISRDHRHELLARDFPAPLQDPFYRAPHNLSKYKPGEVIESRKVQPAMFGLLGRGDTTQIHYRTTNAEGHPSSSVTTVIQPVGNPKSEKMLSYHLWEDSTQRDCAPSYTVLLGQAAPNVLVVGDDVPVWFDFALSNGISVVIPDYEGPKSALFAGFTAGYAILDSARAVRAQLGWSNQAQVSMTGYSEGAHVTAWAANLAPSYANDLNIVGVSHGGTPIDMELTLKHFDGTSFSGFSLGGIHGMTVAYKEFKKVIQQYGNAELKSDLQKIITPPTCHAILRGADFSGKAYLDMIDMPDDVEDIFEWEPVRYVLDRETLWDNKSSVGVGYPTFPRMIYHGNADDVINFQAVDAYVKQQCAHKGVQIQFNSYTADAHTNPELVIGGDLNAMKATLMFFNNNGKFDTDVPCGEPTPTLLNLGTLAVDAVLGFDVLGAFGRFVGQVTDFSNIGFGAKVSAKTDAVKHTKSN